MVRRNATARVRLLQMTTHGSDAAQKRASERLERRNMIKTEADLAKLTVHQREVLADLARRLSKAEVGRLLQIAGGTTNLDVAAFLRTVEIAALNANSSNFPRSSSGDVQRRSIVQDEISSASSSLVRLNPAAALLT